MAIVINPRVLVGYVSYLSDSDSIKSLAGLEYDSIESFSSADLDSKNTGLAYSDEVFVQNAQETDNLKKIDDSLIDSLKAEEKYMAQKDR